MYSYYEDENMSGKKLTDLKNDEEFLSDALTFLRGSRKNYKEEDLQGMSGEDVVYDVLNHFRTQIANEVTMAKDYYYIDNDKTSQAEKEAFGRLMFAFDRAEGEGILDGGGAAILDYGLGFASAPSTFATVAAVPFTGGAGSVAAQTAKQGTLMTLRALAKKNIGRATMTAAMDGALAGASQYGLEKIKQKAGREIGIDYDVNQTAVGAAAVLGGAVSGTASIIMGNRQTKAAERLATTIATGEKKKVKELAEAAKKAETAIKRVKSREEAKLFDFTSMKILRSIDPKLVEEGMDLKKTLLSEGLDDGLIGGLDRSVVKRLGAAAYELAGKLGVKPEEGQRITEYLARAVEEGHGAQLFDDVADKYGLTRRQLSAVYAAEVSEAAKLLATQRNLVTNGGVKISKLSVDAFRQKLDMLYDEGMSQISGREATELTQAQLDAMSGVGGKVWRGFKNLEDARRAFMTSQPATTMRNNIFGGLNAGIDTVDQIFLAAIKRVKGDKAAARSTLRNSAKTLTYLTDDHYVAEALTTMLSQEAPEKMSRVFLNAAQAEAATQGNTRLGRLGSAANVLNTMSDHVFKRAVIASVVDRELGTLGNKQLGTSVMDMLEKGTISQLPDNILDKALNESFAFTFQRRFGGKDASGLNQAAGKAIKFIHDSGLTVAIPFPRYIASQAKFISDYTGLTIARRLASGKKAIDEDYARFMTGAAMFAGAYAIQRGNIEKGREWYEAEAYDGQPYNAQAAWGPAAFTQWSANLIARIMEGKETKTGPELIREANKILVGTEFRPNAGIADKWVQAIGAGDLTPVFDSVGDYFASYTYPLAVVKDFYGQFDSRSSFFPETRDPTVTSYYVNIPIFETGFNLRMSTFQRMSRQLPDFNLNEMSKALKDTTGIDLGETHMKGLLKYLGGASRTQYQTMLDPTNGDTGYDMVRFDIFSDGPIRVNNPMAKQLTGLVGVQPKNELQRELSRLQIDPFTLYNPYREKNPALEVLTQAALQGVLPAMVKQDVMDRPDYATATDAVKKRAITKYVKTLITEKRNVAEDVLRKQQGKSPDFDAYIRGEVQAMSYREQNDADLHWEAFRDSFGYSDMSYEEALQSIRKDPELDEQEKESRQTTLSLMYLTGQKTVDKAFREFGKLAK